MATSFAPVFIRRVAPAIRELQALGLIEVTRKGYRGAADVHEPSWYRLTYVSAWNAGRADGTGTHEYLRFQTKEDATTAQKAARLAADPDNVARGKKYFASPESGAFRPRNLGSKAKIPTPELGLLSQPRNLGVLSISRGRSPKVERAVRPCGE